MRGGTTSPMAWLVQGYTKGYFFIGSYVGDPAIPLDAWTHLALVRESGVFRAYFNGALVFTDIMGVQTRVEAVLDRMDLMENFIFIKDAKA